MTLAHIVAPLFVPADRPQRFEKAAMSGADAVILDLEDAVSPAEKPGARANLRIGFTPIPIIVRINAIGTPWHEDDVARVLQLRPAAIMLPKAEMGPLFAALVERLMPVAPVVALVETARGLETVRDIAALPGIARLAFGSWDYCADMGCDHTDDALLPARHELVLASRLAAKPAPIDGVAVAIDDADALSAAARYARSMGFGAKLTIHPRQVAPVMAGFAPQPQEVDWARRVLASGDGAASLDGAMVDEPVRARARAILARASRL